MSKEILAVYDRNDNYEAEIEYRLTEKRNELETLISRAKESWKTLDKKALAEVSSHFSSCGMIKTIVNLDDYIKFLISNSELDGYTIEVESRGKKKIEIDEKTIRKETYEDYEIDNWHYNDFIDSLNEAVKDYVKDFGYWKIEGKNLDWQGTNATGYVHADTGEQLFEAIKPNTDDLTVYFYKGAGKTIEARISHHDCPTGSYYIIKPITQKTYEKYAK